MTKSTIVILLLIATQLQGQNLTKAYTYLQKNKFAKSEDLFLQKLDKDNTDPYAKFGLSLLYSEKKFSNYNYFLAYKLVIEAINTSERLTKDFTYHGQLLTKNYMELSADSIERKLYRFVTIKGRISTYNMFIRSCPNSRYLEEARLIRDRKAYEEIKDSPFVSHYTTYIREYPNAKQVPEATRKRDKLAFKQAEKGYSPKSYNRFMKDFPESDQYWEAKKARDTLAYRQAIKASTIESFNWYIKHYPNGSDLAKIRTKRDSLAYRIANAINTPESFNKFLQRYPAAPQAKLAQNKHFKLLYSEAKQGSNLQYISAFIQAYKKEPYYSEIANRQSDTLGLIYTSTASIKALSNRFFQPENESINFTKFISAQTKEGGFAYTGIYKDSNTRRNILHVKKLNANGDFAWATKPDVESMASVSHIGIDQNERVFISGSYRNATAENTKNWIIKLGEGGKQYWNLSVTDINIHNLLVAGDGNIWLMGREGNTQQGKLIIRSINTDGKTITNFSLLGINKKYLAKAMGNNLLIFANSELMLLNAKAETIYRFTPENSENVVNIFAKNATQAVILYRNAGTDLGVFNFSLSVFDVAKNLALETTFPSTKARSHITDILFLPNDQIICVGFWYNTIKHKKPFFTKVNFEGKLLFNNYYEFEHDISDVKVAKLSANKIRVLYNRNFKGRLLMSEFNQ